MKTTSPLYLGAPKRPLFPWILGAAILILVFTAGLKSGRALSSNQVLLPEPNLNKRTRETEQSKLAPVHTRAPLPAQEKDATSTGIITQLNRTISELDWHVQASTWLKQASEEELIAALQQVQQIPNRDLRGTFKALAFERWGEIDGPMALAYLQLLPEHNYEDRELMTRMCSGWVLHDSAAAIEALVSSDKGSSCVNYVTDETLLQQTFTTLSSSDHELANEFAIQLARMPERKGAAEAAMRGLARQRYEQGGAAAALAWRNELPPDVRGAANLEPAISAAVNRKDITGATEILRETGVAGISGYTLMHYTQNLAAASPQIALDWVTTLPPGDTKSYAFWGLVSANPPENDFSWLSRFPPGPATNALIIDHLDGKLDFWPERSLKLAAYLTDEADRNRIMKQCALTWMSRSPEDAKKSLPADWVAWWESKQVVVSEADVPSFPPPKP